MDLVNVTSHIHRIISLSRFSISEFADMQVANTRYFFFDAYLRSRVDFRSSIRAHFFVDGVGHTVGRRTPMGRILPYGKAPAVP